MRPLLTVWGCLLLLFACHIGVRAQGVRVVSYRVDQGLPTDLTKDVAQDRFGYIWAATDEGIVQFDGVQFKNYLNVLPTNYVKSFLRRRNGDLLVIDDLSVTQIISSPDTVIFKRVLNGSKSPTDSTVHYPKLAYDDRDGNLWISEPSSVARWRDGRLTRYVFGEAHTTSSFMRSFAFAEDEHGTLWLSSYTGSLFYWNKRNDTFEQVLMPVGTKIEQINVLRAVAPGKLWAGSYTGLFEISVTADRQVAGIRRISDVINISCIANYEGRLYAGTWNQGFYRYEPGKKQELFKLQEYPFANANTLFVSGIGDMWISSDAGLHLFQTTFFTTYKLGQEGDAVRSYIQHLVPAAGGFYVSDGAGLFRLEERDGVMVSRSMYSDKGLILSLHHDARGLWAGHFFSRVLLFQQDKVVRQFDLKDKGDGIFSLASDAKGHVWVCQDNAKGVTRIDDQFATHFYGLDKGFGGVGRVARLSAASGQLYIGGIGKDTYLYRYNAAQDQFENLSVPIDWEVKGEFLVEDMAIDSQDRVWLATNAGLLLYDKGRLSRLETGDMTRLPVRAVALADDNTLWFGNALGVIEYHLRQNEFVLFDETNGLGTKTVSNRCIIIDAQHQLWLGTSNGLSRSQEKLLASKETPRPLLTGCRINGQRIGVDSLSQDKLVFAGKVFLEWNYRALSYPGEKILYEFRLLGSSNEEWSEPSQIVKQVFPNLEPGTYTLEIRALQRQGGYSWSKPLSVTFEIRPAWHSTWQAYIVYALLGVGLLYGAWKYQTRRLLKRQQHLEAIVRARTEEISIQRDKLAEAHQSVSLLNQIGKEITAQLSVEGISAAAFGHITRQLQADILGIGVFDQQFKWLEFPATVVAGEQVPLYTYRMHEQNRLAVRCFQEQKEYLSGQAPKDFAQFELYQTESGHLPESVVYLPVVYQDHTLGVLTVQSYQSQAYSSHHVAILRNIVTYIGIALSNFRVYREINEKNQSITASLTYAERIQKAILPDISRIRSVLPDSFVYFRPRDIVSGDFYWFALKEQKVIIAAADCTGHGVPGAFMSMIGNDLLNQLVHDKEIHVPAQILDGIHQGIMNLLRQNEGGTKDGMDIAITTIDLTESSLSFAGARSSLFYVQDGVLTEIKPDRMPIGGGYVEQEQVHFTSHTLALDRTTMCYMCSDGYKDQFNPDGKKFLIAPFKKMLGEMHSLPIAAQEQILHDRLEDWRGDYRQIDDILVVGFRITPRLSV